MGQLFILAPVPPVCAAHAAIMAQQVWQIPVTPLLFPHLRIPGRYEVSPSLLTAARHLRIGLKVWGG